MVILILFWSVNQLFNKQILVLLESFFFYLVTIGLLFAIKTFIFKVQIALNLLVLMQFNIFITFSILA